MNGALCISLDFEKFWGVHDLKKLSELEHFSKIDSVVERTLALFEKYNIHCTWAVVGMLNFENLKELKGFSGTKKMNYQNVSFSPFPLSKYELEKYEANLYLAKNTINRVKNTANQEIASHTFSHFYCLELGTNKSHFIDDLNDFKNALNLEPKSIVFPRNQVNSDYLKLTKDFGYQTYRGNQENVFWKNSSFNKESLLKKIGRFTDAYAKITKDNLIDWKNINRDSGLINIPASRFLRPYTYVKYVEKLKINRIKKQMLKAAKFNQIYHLWWHPHNFTINTDLNFEQLEKILKYQNELHMEFNFKSLNMEEISKTIE